MNKYQEALYEVSSFIRNNSEVVDGCFKGQYALNVLQELVDKETPMKPVKRDSMGMTSKDCGICEMIVSGGFTVGRKRYCSECGQKIDWND